MHNLIIIGFEWFKSRCLNTICNRIVIYQHIFQMLKGIIIPLVIPSLIVAVGSLDIGLSGTKNGSAYS